MHKLDVTENRASKQMQCDGSNSWGDVGVGGTSDDGGFGCVVL